MMSSQSRKCRTLYLADPQQVERAASLLRHGFGIRVLAMPELSRLMLVYQLQPLCSLVRILARLEAARIALAGHWWQQLQQRLICYGEAIQLQQQRCPLCAIRGRQSCCHGHLPQQHGGQDGTPEQQRQKH